MLIGAKAYLRLSDNSLRRIKQEQAVHLRFCGVSRAELINA